MAKSKKTDELESEEEGRNARQPPAALREKANALRAFAVQIEEAAKACEEAGVVLKIDGVRTSYYSGADAIAAFIRKARKGLIDEGLL